MKGSGINESGWGYFIFLVYIAIFHNDNIEIDITIMTIVKLRFFLFPSFPFILYLYMGQ